MLSKLVSKPGGTRVWLAVLAQGEGAVSSRTSAAWLIRKLVEGAGGRVELADGEPGVLLLAAVLPA